MKLLAPALAALLLSSASTGQTVGWRDLQVSNPSQSGSAQLRAKLYYPSRRSGASTPLDRSQAPFSAVVFLAGYSLTGDRYDMLGKAIAARGHLAVMNQTASLDPNLLGLDGKAWLAGLEQENASSSSFLSGAVDMQRIAILGHSVGGANVFRVLAEEPRYRVGACFAPMITPPNYALQVRQPLAVIVGEGDLVTPPATHARPNWDLVQPYSGVKLYYLLDPTANHLNVALGAEPGGTVIDRAIFERCSDVALSFVDHYLTGDSHAFDRCVGSEARSEIHLKQLEHVCADPVLFERGTTQLGQAHEIVTCGQPGVAMQLIAASTSQISTPVGLLELDPATTSVLLVTLTGPTGLGRFAWSVPKQSSLIGLNLYVQGLAQLGPNHFALSNPLRLVIQP